MTTITAIARAGGFTARARRSAMTISRNDDDSVRSVDATAEILPGDILTIHERFF
jgi:protein involved in polysaccharide export with SLBB domain